MCSVRASQLLAQNGLDTAEFRLRCELKDLSVTKTSIASVLSRKPDQSSQSVSCLTFIFIPSQY
jgi:hypothetical protein